MLALTEEGLQTLYQVGLSAGIMVAVTLLIVAVFGQTGRVEMSPQRQAALATGHSDRRTVFEQPLLRPLVWLLLGMSHRLAMPKFKDWLRRTLVAAGSPEYYTAEEYLALSLLTGVALGGVFELVYVLWPPHQLSFMIAVVGLVLGTGLNLYQLYSRADNRVRLISKRVPYAIDLIALAMGAGATFTEAVSAVVRKARDEEEDPFHTELRAMLAEIELGTTRRQALMNLADRVPLDLLRSIVASVIQAEELGTPLADVLHSEATLLRMQRSVRAENAAAVASVRILVPSLLILMSVVLAVFAPAIVRIFRRGLF